MIGGAFWTPGATVIGGNTPTFDQQIQKLFANGKQGFFYDPNDLSTMFQNVAGAIPVTAVGQPVGLMLDKSKGLLSIEKVTNPDFDTDTAWIKVVKATISNGNAVLTSVTGNPALSQNTSVSPNKWYELTINVISLTSGALVFRVYGVGGGNDALLSIKSAGVYKTIFRARSDATGLIGFSASATSAKIDSVSIKETAGNHAYQTTSAARPILQDVPKRIDFDTVDDKLITSLPAQLTGCTVIRSVPNVGTQIMTGQTIPATYEDNTDHCGLIVINRALTHSETSAITSEFNKRAGV